MKIALAAVGACIAAALITFVWLTSSALTRDDHQISQLQGQLAQQPRNQMQLNAQVSNFGTQLSQLTTPTDPLSAYDQICNAQLQNSATGVTQAYYYPCTNNAQTIPRPGS
jgi:septal ring factor EnvC (AmiA/AmiB activator)